MKQTILNLWQKKWNIFNDNSRANYGEGNYNTEVLISNLCNYNDAYILVRGDITVRAAPCAPFTKYITKIDWTTIDGDKDLDLVMPM